jgi:RNA polymerase sigma factor (sigma-70 family)
VTSPAGQDRFAAARSGERRAQAEISELIARFARHACDRAGSRLGADLDWEDVAQEASRKFFTTGIHQYRGKGSEESYLYTIVKSTLVQIARSASRRRQREEASVSRDPVQPAPHDSLDVAWILRRLTEDCRHLLRQVFLEETPYPRLAAELGLAESSVRAKVSRCVRRARELAT